MIRMLIVATAATVSGCATAPREALPFSEASLGKPDADSAIVVVYRDLVPPYAYDVRVFVDDERVGQLPNEAFTWTRVRPGKRNVALKWPFIAATPGDTVELAVEAGRTYFISVDGGVDMFIPNAYGGTAVLASDARLASYGEAIEELRNCCRYVPADGEHKKNGTR